jgi:hypothetical protein
LATATSDVRPPRPTGRGYGVRFAFAGRRIDTPTPMNRWCRKRLSFSSTYRFASKSAPDGLSTNA